MGEIEGKKKKKEKRQRGKQGRPLPKRTEGGRRGAARTGTGELSAGPLKLSASRRRPHTLPRPHRPPPAAAGPRAARPGGHLHKVRAPPRPTVRKAPGTCRRGSGNATSAYNPRRRRPPPARRGPFSPYVPMRAAASPAAVTAASTSPVRPTRPRRPPCLRNRARAPHSPQLRAPPPRAAPTSLAHPPRRGRGGTGGEGGGRKSRDNYRRCRGNFQIRGTPAWAAAVCALRVPAYRSTATSAPCARFLPPRGTPGSVVPDLHFASGTCCYPSFLAARPPTATRPAERAQQFTPSAEREPVMAARPSRALGAAPPMCAFLTSRPTRAPS